MKLVSVWKNLLAQIEEELFISEIPLTSQTYHNHVFSIRELTHKFFYLDDELVSELKTYLFLLKKLESMIKCNDRASAIRLSRYLRFVWLSAFQQKLIGKLS